MARNAGIAAASGRIVLFNDSDILASPTCSRRTFAVRRARAFGGRRLEVQVKDLDDYRFKRDHPAERGHLHPPSRTKLTGYIS